MLELRTLLQISTLLLLAWGALAFGAEYSWAYAPLLVFSLVPTLLGLRATSGSTPSRLLMLAIGLVFLAGAFQYFLPARIIPLDWQTPPDVDFGRLYALVTLQPAAEAAGRISIAPGRTMLGLVFLLAFALLFVGCTRGVSALGPKRFIHGIIALGCVVALIGLIQAAVKTETIYGFWRGPKAGDPFAPFLNRNHFTGWMAMVVSLTIGSFAADLSVALKNVKRGWRNRLHWFSSQRASGMMLTGFAVGMMALSMVVASSRGGLIGLLFIFVLGTMMILRRQSGRRRLIGGASLLVLIIFVLSWGHADKTFAEFVGGFADWGGRKFIWMDTVNVIRDYPVTGTGLNTFGIAMLHYKHNFVGGTVVEAHNDYLQLAAEGGLLLCLPIVVALGLFVDQVRRRFAERLDDEETYWLRAGAVIGLLAIAVMETFDFTLQMAGAAAMFVVLAAIAVHRPNHLRREGAGSAKEHRQ